MVTPEEHSVEEEESTKHAGKSHEKGTKSETTDAYKERMRNFNKELMEKVKESSEEPMSGTTSKASKRAAASEEASASE